MKTTALTTRLAALALAGALALGLTGCGAGSSDTAAASQEMSQSVTEDSSAAGGSGALLDPSASTSESSRKIIYTASVEMESTDFAGAQAAILAAVEQTGAYLESTDLWGSAEDADRSARYTVRVPVDNYRQLLAALGEAGSVLNQSESASDVTANYIDVEARLTALEAQRDRLNELADQAETTADLLEIESQLSDVQYQIESYTAQLRSLDSQITYSTVDVYLSEVAELTPTGTTFGDRLAAAFFGGWQAFADLIEGLFLAIVYLLPLLLLAAAIVAVCVVLGRRRRARRAARRAGQPGAWSAAPQQAGKAEPQPNLETAGKPDAASTPDAADKPGADPAARPEPPASQPGAPKSGPKY
ncbi:MAG TPA: DUF4349 domain-containing protein [Candidatus Gemmiger faecigallinarum]|nr:DUF4349 domain-containing protein [Candidatus Gemmiger faecigallinarum]